MELGIRPFVAAATVLLAGPLAGDLAAGDCRGCVGLTNHAGSALASCFTPPVNGWQISAAFEIESGDCDDLTSGLAKSCDPEPCSGTITYAWGKEVAGGIQEVGYHQTRPTKEAAPTWQFGEKPPWEAGKAGSLSFGPEVDPTLDCGRVYTFFIKADHCGPMEATVWASCTACGLPMGK